MKTCNLIILVLSLFNCAIIKAQNDSTYYTSNVEYANNHNPYKFSFKQIIIPTAFIGVGVLGLKSDWMKYQIHEMRDELQENITQQLKIDDYTQYAPMLAVYGLNLFGVKGKHNFIDRTIILGTAYALMGITVNTLKTSIKVERPDGSNYNSFPSGHTATAFMTATFMRLENMDISPWVGVAGYVATWCTGFMRN